MPGVLSFSALKTSRTRVLLVALAAAALGASAACGEENPACYEGDHRACSCGGASQGYQACIVPEAAYGACVCDGVTPGVDASADAADAANAAESGAADAAPSGKRGLFEPCSTNDDCESGLCHDFPAKGGLLCSQSCDDTRPCPPPSTGCNNKGVCKAP